MASEPTPSSRRRPRTRGRRVALAVVAGLATFAILLVLDGLWAGRALLRGLSGARTQLGVAIESIVTGDPESAAPHFTAAQRAADDALGAVVHPSLGIAGIFPIAGDNIDAAAAVAEASRATADAGAAMVEVARALGWTDIRIPASAAAGDLDIEAFQTALPDMRTVVARLRRALRTLEAGGGGGLLGPVASGYRDAVDGLARRADLAKRLGDSMHLVTTMFGGRHRYLVCVPVLGVPRPGGGTPAAVGVLEADGGMLRLGPLTAAPKDLADVDVSIDWPTTAKALLEAAEGEGLADLDGAILVDAVALEELVGAIGDVEVDGVAQAFSDRTTTTTLEVDTFLGNTPPRAAQRHADRATQILRAFLERRPGVESFALAVAGSARDRHLSIYLPGRAGRRLVQSLGVDGRARLGGGGAIPVVATWEALGNAHVGALVRTTVRHTITLRDDGSAAVAAEVVFENDAGTDPPSVFLGRPADGVPVGTFTADVALSVPQRAQEIAAETSRPSEIRVDRERGLATVTGSIGVRGGESATLTVTYVMPDAVRTVDGARQVDLRILPQPTMAGVRFQIRVVLPEGSAIVSTSPELEAHGRAASFSEVRGGPVDLELRFGAGV